MTEVLSLLQQPFVQRTIIAGIVLAIMAAIMGVLTLIRKAAFYGDAIAHSSLAGVAIGLWLGWFPLATAMLYAVAVALLLPAIKRFVRLPLDTILGILLPTSMGLGVLIFALLPGYQPEMMSFLFGSMIAIKQTDLLLLLLLFGITSVLFILYLPKLLFIALDDEYASLLHIKSPWLERMYEVLLAILIIAGVKLVGVILINAILIIPASTARLFSKSLTKWVRNSVLCSIIMVLGGLLLSLVVNVPPGATIAVFSGILFLATAVVTSFTGSARKVH